MKPQKKIRRNKKFDYLSIKTSHNNKGNVLVHSQCKFTKKIVEIVI